MVSKIDLTSVSPFCSTDQIAMVYGFEHCKYKEVGEALQENRFTILDYTQGSEHLICPLMKTKVISGMYDSTWVAPRLQLKRQCKSGLVNFIIRNFLQKKTDPILFCVDVDHNPHPLVMDELLDRKATYTLRD